VVPQTGSLAVATLGAQQVADTNAQHATVTAALRHLPDIDIPSLGAEDRRYT
jgi:hypothetical protein